MEKCQTGPPPATGQYPPTQNFPRILQQQGQPYSQSYPQPYSQSYPQPYPQQQQPQQPGSVHVQGTANVVTIQTTAQSPRERNAHYNSKGSKRTGLLQIVIAVLSIALGVVAIVIKCHLADGGTPIWTGLMFILVTGILGVSAGKSKKTCTIIAYMVMCIITACMSFNAFIVELVAATNEHHKQECEPTWNCHDFPSDYIYHYYGYGTPCCKNLPNVEGRTAVDVLLVCLFLTEMIICIVASTMCCRGVCCRPSSGQNQSMVVYHPHQMVGVVPGQVIPAGNVTIQQYAVAQPQPTAPPTAPTAPPQFVHQMQPAPPGHMPYTSPPPPYCAEYTDHPMPGAQV